MHRHLKRLLPLLLVLLAVGIALMMIRARPALPRNEVERPAPPVELQRVAPGEVSLQIRAQGTVRARRQLDLVSEVTGRIEWMAPEFLEGERIAEGTVLLRIDPTDYRVALADARAALANAEMALADATALKRRAAAAEAAARVEAAKERIRQAEHDLAQTAIRAPFNALIDARLVELGQFLTIGRGVARLIGTDLAEVRLQVTPADAGFLDQDNEQAVELSAVSGALSRYWRGRLARIEKRIDEQTRTVAVIVEIELPYDTERHDTPLELGLFVEASLPGRPVAGAVTMPRSALHGGNSVFIYDNGFLRRREVHVLRLDEGQALIDAGLDEGEEVVVTRLDLMFEGMPVSRADG